MSTNPLSIFQQPRPDLSPTRPQPTSWEDYVAWLMPEWEKLKDSSLPERDFQEFLERNPSLVPSFYGMGDAHHGIQGSALFSQPPLNGVDESRRPDFMWIHANSVEVHPVFIEIERSSKKFFNDKSDPSKASFTAEFNQALAQLREWQAWWAEPTNQQVFRHDVLRDYTDTRRVIKPRYILVYGRAAELSLPSESKVLERKLSEQYKDGIELVMTYDRLHPNQAFSDFPTLHHERTGSVKLKGVPASLTTGPFLRKLYARTPTPDRELFNNPLWTQDRSEYVHGRWEHWAKQYINDPKVPFGDTRNPTTGE